MLRQWLFRNCKFAASALWDEKYRNYGDFGAATDEKLFFKQMKEMKSEWFNLNRQLAGEAKIVELSSPDGTRKFYIHHTANSGPEKYQLSVIINGQPISHSIYDTRDQALQDVCCGDWGLPGAYKVTATR